MLFNKIVAVELKKLLHLPAGLARTVSLVVMLRAAEL